MVGRGRPKIGERFCLKLPPALDEALDEFCLAHGTKRAEAARHLIERGLSVSASSGRVGKPNSKRASSHEASDDCRHPVGRRIGKTCMVCGKEVGK